jgi:hypothetical protein
MGYAAIALAALGFTSGLLFRLKTLLLLLGLLLVSSIMFSLGSGFSFLDSALTIMATQTIVQGSYFLGLLARAALAAGGVRQIL